MYNLNESRGVHIFPGDLEANRRSTKGGIRSTLYNICGCWHTTPKGPVEQNKKNLNGVTRRSRVPAKTALTSLPLRLETRPPLTPAAGRFLSSLGYEHSNTKTASPIGLDIMQSTLLPRCCHGAQACLVTKKGYPHLTVEYCFAKYYFLRNFSTRVSFRESHFPQAYFLHSSVASLLQTLSSSQSAGSAA